MIKGYVELNFKGPWTRDDGWSLMHKRLFPVGSFIAIREQKEKCVDYCEIRYVSGEYIGFCIETYEQVKSLIIKASRGKNNGK